MTLWNLIKICGLIIIFYIAWISMSTSNAMTFYIVPDDANPLSKVIVGAEGFVPKNVIKESPIDPSTGNQVIDIDILKDDLSGVDLVKKAQKQADQNAAKQASDALELERKNRLNRIKAACNNEVGLLKDLCEHVSD